MKNAFLLGLRAVLFPALLIGGVYAYATCASRKDPAEQHAPTQSSVDDAVRGVSAVPMAGGEADAGIDGVVFRQYRFRIDLGANMARIEYDTLGDGDVRYDLVGERRVITGRLQTPTAVGTFRRRDILINPVWNIPASIGSGSVPPGPQNPLGPVAVRTRNGQLVHGTNTPWLFRNPVNRRYLSHGCIRLDGIVGIFCEIFRHNTYEVRDMSRESWPRVSADPAAAMTDPSYPRYLVRLDHPVEIVVER